MLLYMSNKVTPKDFFLWAAAMVFLYMGVFNFIKLIWDYINYALPNPLASYYLDPYQSGISWEMATLIVVLPVFMLLMWVIRRDIRTDATRRDIWVRRWALYLTLFIAGITAVIDLIYVLYAFLNGTDVTEGFILKALVVFLVMAIGFMHFLADLWNYWEQYPARNRSVAIATVVLVLATIGAGFLIVGTPAHARLVRFDQQKVNDLQNIQYQVVNYWQQKQKLPTNLNDLNDSIGGNTVPKDPQTGAPYVYQSTGALSFKLCATFNAPSPANNNPENMGRTVPVPASVAPIDYGMKQDSWTHAVGEECFTRTIDPSRYPPYKNGKPL
jgi:hypothetical protein